MTGNIRRKAQFKIEAHGIAEFFDLEIGAFADDAEQRDELGTFVVARARHRGLNVVPSDFTVVGDTSGDVSCARAAGFNVIAVAHGAASGHSLQAVDPDLVIDDLESLPRALLCGRQGVRPML